MNKFQTYMNEQFVGTNPDRRKIGKDIFKALKENCKDKLGYIPMKPMALIEVREQDSPVLSGIGFSEPDDLLTNIFGAWLSGVICDNSNQVRNLSDVNGVVQPVPCHSTISNNTWAAITYRNFQTQPRASLGGLLRIGQGGMSGWSPARSDFDLNTPFAASPEADFITVQGAPPWIQIDQEAIVSGLVAQTAFAGTVGECGMYGHWKTGTSTGNSTFMISHDVAGVSFGSGANLQVTYTWSLS